MSFVGGVSVGVCERELFFVLLGETGEVFAFAAVAADAAVVDAILDVEVEGEVVDDL